MCQANLITLTHLVLFRGQGRAWPCSKGRTRSVLGTMQLSEFLLHVLNTSGQLSILEKGINTTLMKLQLSYDDKLPYSSRTHQSTCVNMHVYITWWAHVQHALHVIFSNLIGPCCY